MNDSMTVEDRIVAKFLEKLTSDHSIPQEVVNRLKSLWEEGRLEDVHSILSAIREGVKDHAENSTT